MTPFLVAIIGAGPAGLMAAQVLSEAGCKVTVYDRMPSPGRKFLMAGRGGLNITHDEPFETFLTRYGSAAPRLAPALEGFPPEALRAWCEALGHPTFVGSSGKVFPKEFKSTPLLRSWLKHLSEHGVVFQFRQRWMGWNENDDLVFEGPEGQSTSAKPGATFLALGGASWPRLGSDGAWVDILKEKKISVASLRPSNCGFAIRWSEHFKHRHAGEPLKSVRARFGDKEVRGEAMITEAGIEGGVIYSLSSLLRESIAQNRIATLHLDLRPDLTMEQLTKRLEAPQKGQSRSTFLRKVGGLSPVAVSLVQEILHKNPKPAESSSKLAALIKALPLTLTAPFPIERAISSAGGVGFNEVGDSFMLVKKPGVFVAGEMLDWEAPTGGYLLQATFSTAVAAAHGLLTWLGHKN